jgi:hypothetical protein
MIILVIIIILNIIILIIIITIIIISINITLKKRSASISSKVIKKFISPYLVLINQKDNIYYEVRRSPRWLTYCSPAYYYSPLAHELLAAAAAVPRHSPHDHPHSRRQPIPPASSAPRYARQRDFGKRYRRGFVITIFLTRGYDVQEKSSISASIFGD